jgi:UDP:flavonoid glycosyltransferase YjiC (YdhE family)
VALYPPYYKAVGPVMPTFYKQLDESLREDMEALEQQGMKVALVSFGSVLKVDPQLIDPIWDALEKSLEAGLLHRVYWSTSSNPSLLGGRKHKDIRVVDWVPQFALLQTKPLSLLITHCGAESVHEGMYAGVPMLAFPIYGDQPGNGMRIQELGIGKAYDRNNLSGTALFNDIKDIILDSTGAYAKQLNKIMHIAHASARNGLLEAVDTIELLAAFGDSFMIPEDREASFIVRNNYDVYLAVLALALLSIHIMWLLLRICFVVVRFLLCRSSKSQKPATTKKKNQ